MPCLVSRLVGSGVSKSAISGKTAVDAVLSMDTENSTALRTLPSILLSQNEFLEPELMYALQILDHAHAVFRSVAFVQLP